MVCARHHLAFTMLVTNELLLEGVGTYPFERRGGMDVRVAHGSFDNPMIERPSR